MWISLSQLDFTSHVTYYKPPIGKSIHKLEWVVTGVRVKIIKANLNITTHKTYYNIGQPSKNQEVNCTELLKTEYISQNQNEIYTYTRQKDIQACL